MSQPPGQRRVPPTATPGDFFVALPGARADASVTGGKARSLQRLATAGCAVPPGFVVRDWLARALLGVPPRKTHAPGQQTTRYLATLTRRIRSAAWPAGFLAALRARLADLSGQRFCVRSSFALEDDGGHGAPGVYESVINVAPGQVANAIRAVLASALSPGAVAYARAAGRDPLAAPLAVLIHPFVAAHATGHAVMMRAGGRVEVATWIRSGRLPERQRQRLAARLRRSPLRLPVEVEWAAHAGGFTFLQARPFDGKPAQAEPAGRQRKTRGRAWQWDAAHNPMPLSPAQADLVALVNRRCRVGFRQRVRGGYLFYRPGGPVLAAPRSGPAARALLLRLDRRITRELARIQTLTSPVEALRAACALFVASYQPLLGTVGRAVRDGRAALTKFLTRHRPDLAGLQGELLLGVASAATRRRDAWRRVCTARGIPARRRAWRHYQAAFGADTPIWDVAIATVGEQTLAAQRAPDQRSAQRTAGSGRPPARAAASARRVRDRLTSRTRAAFDRILREARAALALGEDDDWLYARLQAAVRHALLRVGQALAARSIIARPNDVFYLPLATSLALARAGLPKRGVIASIKKAQARAAAQTLNPPLAAAAQATARGAPHGVAVITGIGVGGRAIGRVRLHPARKNAPRRRGTVVVARTLLPTELPLLDACALVTETGGWLDHVAAQARERDLPAVVSAHGALAHLADDDLVLVDGNRGLVYRLGGPAARARR